jgi:hypothetical protein
MDKSWAQMLREAIQNPKPLPNEPIGHRVTGNVYNVETGKVESITLEKVAEDRWIRV